MDSIISKMNTFRSTNNLLLQDTSVLITVMIIISDISACPIHPIQSGKKVMELKWTY